MARSTGSAGYHEIRSGGNPAVSDQAEVYGMLFGDEGWNQFILLPYTENGWESSAGAVYCFPAESREEAISLIKDLTEGVPWLAEVVWE